MPKKRRKFKRYLFIILSFIFFAIGFTLLYLGLQNRQVITVEYSSKENIDYKVYLKPNNFFETPYLGKGQTYISSLIDYISASLEYEQTYNKNVSGNYNYEVKAIISADKPRGAEGNYWQKEYVIVGNNIVKIDNDDSFKINLSNKIDYQKYNELLQAFKKEYVLSIDGKLKIQLTVNSEVTPIGMTKKVKSERTMELSIPLTEQSVDLSINTKTGENNKSEVKEIMYLTDLKYKIEKIAGFVFIGLALLSLLGELFRIIKIRRETSEYTKKVNKILTTYNAIIVNTKNNIDLKKYNVVNVESFDELIDAHSEIRMPINYIKKEFGSQFILINNDMAWVYSLKKNGDFDEENQ